MSTIDPVLPLAPTNVAPRLRWWMLLIIALVALAVYANSIANGFAYDDRGVLGDNPRVTERQWTELWNTGYWPEWEGTPDVLYRPLTIWSYVVNQSFAPDTPWPFHATNVALHALVSVLVALLAYRLTERRLPTMIAGLLFAIHPLHTEVVANVVGRAEMLAALWSLLALLIMLPQKGLFQGPQPRAWWHGWLVAACFFLAILSKETPAAMLGAIGILDIWRWSQWKTNRPTLFKWLRSQTWRYYFPLTVAFGVYMAMRLHAVGFMTNNKTVHPIVNLLLWADIPQRIFTPFVLLAKYLTLMVWPRILLADYSAPSILPVSNPFNPQAALGILLCVAAIIAVILNWRKRPAISAALILLFFSYFLVANVIRIGTIFGERLFYFPSAFVIILMAIAATGGWDRLKSSVPPALLRIGAVAVPAGCCALTVYLFREYLFTNALTFILTFGLAAIVLATIQWKRGNPAVIACAVSCVCLSLLSIRTITRNPDWKDNLDLAIATAADNPTSSKALAWAGQELVLHKENKWLVSIGVDLLKRAVEAYPSNGQAYWDLARYYGALNQNDIALVYLAAAARFHAGKPDIRVALTLIREDIETRDSKEFVPGVVSYLNANPNDPTAYFAAGIASWATHNQKQAEEMFNHALALDPHYEECRMELAQLKMEEGYPEEAANLMKEYIKMAGYNIPARCQYITALLAIDPHTNQGASLDEADRQIKAASQQMIKDPHVPLLHQEYLEKRAEYEGRASALESHPLISQDER